MYIKSYRILSISNKRVKRPVWQSMRDTKFEAPNTSAINPSCQSSLYFLWSTRGVSLTPCSGTTFRGGIEKLS